MNNPSGHPLPDPNPLGESLVIPNDLAACQALIGELAQAVSEMAAREQKLHDEKAELQLAYNELLQQAFRRRSERYLEDPHQLKLDLGGTDEAADAAEGLAEAIAEVTQAETIVAEYTRRRRVPKQPRSEQLPAHLPRYEVPLEVPDDVQHCPEHGERTLIGHDRIETLEFERPKLKVACGSTAACCCRSMSLTSP